jgi:hypothetical protein
MNSLEPQRLAQTYSNTFGIKPWVHLSLIQALSPSHEAIVGYAFPSAFAAGLGEGRAIHILSLVKPLSLLLDVTMRGLDARRNMRPFDRPLERREEVFDAARMNVPFDVSVSPGRSLSGRNPSSTRDGLGKCPCEPPNLA